MKARKIVNVMERYNAYQTKIEKCVAKRNDFDAWDDDSGVREMNKKINRLKNELGRFLDTEV